MALAHARLFAMLGLVGAGCAQGPRDVCAVLGAELAACDLKLDEARCAADPSAAEGLIGLGCEALGGVSKSDDPRAGFILPRELTTLYYVTEPSVEVTYFAQGLPAKDPGVLQAQAALLEELRETTFYSFGMFAADPGTKLNRHFDREVSGTQAEMAKVEGVTHRARIEVTARRTINEALLPNITFAAPLEIEARVVIDRFDGAAASLEGASACVPNERCDVRVLIKNAIAQLGDAMARLPDFDYHSLSQGRVVTSNATLGEPRAINDANSATVSTMEVPYARVIDRTLWLFGGDYEFDPTYLWLDLGRGMVADLVSLRFGRGPRPYEVKLLVTTQEDPGPPSPTSPNWVVAHTWRDVDGVYDAVSKYIDLELPPPERLVVRHVAAYWVPPTTDDDGTHRYEVVNFDVYEKPERRADSPPPRSWGIGP